MARAALGRRVLADPTSGCEAGSYRQSRVALTSISPVDLPLRPERVIWISILVVISTVDSIPKRPTRKVGFRFPGYTYLPRLVGARMR
jgi:hypothetical protein